MFPTIAREAFFAAAVLKRALSWPARFVAARAALSQLAGMSDVELRDIGLVRQDVVDIGALRRDASRSASAERRAAPRGAKFAV
jgi:uncharacterized protein YjiS (DUF1127 family)